jgi:hypothetical protein
LRNRFASLMLLQNVFPTPPYRILNHIATRNPSMQATPFREALFRETFVGPIPIFIASEGGG